MTSTCARFAYVAPSLGLARIVTNCDMTAQMYRVHILGCAQHNSSSVVKLCMIAMHPGEGLCLCTTCELVVQGSPQGMDSFTICLIAGCSVCQVQHSKHVHVPHMSAVAVLIMLPVGQCTFII
jgi:hypothetical protein